MSKLSPLRALSRRNLLAWMATAGPTALLAQQNAAPTETTPLATELQGILPDGRALSLESLRGQVVLVFFWSTECAVCRNKMPEFRANAAGWKGQNFTLLGVNMDERQAAFLRYEELVASLVPAAQKFPSVWGKHPNHKDNLGPIQRLPTAILIDKEGRVAERYIGRIPPQAWDRIADLL